MKKKTRESILEQARKLFSEKGYHETSVSDIISGAGLAQGTFYNYFDSKKAIFIEILRDFSTQLLEKLKAIDATEIKDRTSYSGILLEAGTLILSLLTDNEYLARIFFWEAAGVDEEADDLLNLTYRGLAEISADHIRRGQQIGVIYPEISAEIAAAAHVGMCTYLAGRYLQGDFRESNPLAIMTAILQIHTGGLMLPQK